MQREYFYTETPEEQEKWVAKLQEALSLSSIVSSLILYNYPRTFVLNVIATTAASRLIYILQGSFSIKYKLYNTSNGASFLSRFIYSLIRP